MGLSPRTWKKRVGEVRGERTVKVAEVEGRMRSGFDEGFSLLEMMTVIDREQ